MIFLTVGASEPFDRLVRAVDEWCGSRGCTEVFGQILQRGPNSYRPVHFEWVAYLAPNDFQLRFKDARFVVSHAGTGSILTALGLCKPILVLPRRGHLHETRNDHQYGTATRFATLPGVSVALTEAQLPVLMDRMSAQPGGSIAAAPWSAFAQDGLLQTLRQFIHAPERQ